MNKKRAKLRLRRNGHFTWTKKLAVNKRQKFVLSVLILSSGLFLSEYFFGKYNFFILIFLSFGSSVLFFFSVWTDIKKNHLFPTFILPFIFTLSFGLFYSLMPSRILTRILITGFYAVGLYSMFLSQNILIVASVKAISLVSSARIVSFVLTLVAYFFLTNVIFALHLSGVVLSLLVFTFSFLLIYHSLWSHSFDKTFRDRIPWVLTLSFCLFEIALLLSFWPSSPTVVALFLTGFLYTIAGLTQVWFDRRLFKGVIWEYIWVAVIVFFILILFTSWK